MTESSLFQQRSRASDDARRTLANAEDGAVIVYSMTDANGLTKPHFTDNDVRGSSLSTIVPTCKMSESSPMPTGLAHVALKEFRTYGGFLDRWSHLP